MQKQKPTAKGQQRKKTSLVHELVQPVIDYSSNGFRWLFGLSKGWEKRMSMKQNNFDLGIAHFKRGHISDAIFRFTLVTWMQPGNAKAWYYLGRSQMADGKADLALKSLKKSAELEPRSEETAYMLAVAQGDKAPVGKLPRMMPLILAKDHFEWEASDYDRAQLEDFDYKGHLALATIVREHLPAQADIQLVDLGAGTGLCGARLRDAVTHLAGVDFSPAMLDQAKKLVDAQGNRIYDSLVLREVRDFLTDTAPESYDVAVAGGLISYIGDVNPLFALVAKALKPRGVFCFTADKFDGADYQFIASAGRFAFSEGYLRAGATAAGFSDASLALTEIYPGYKAWLCVFKK